MVALVIDASVAVKWFLEEDRADAARRLRENGDDMIAPASAVFEIFHVLWMSARVGRIPGRLLDDVERLVVGPFTSLVPVEELFMSAARLARSLAHPVYDCAYLALAEREGAPLVTADERLFAAARKARIKAKLL